MRRTARWTVAAATLVAAGATTAPAQAAPYTCEASGLRATLLGQAIEPAVANRGQAACATTKAGGENALPAPVKADVLAAATELLNGDKLQAEQTASASGGVADLRIGGLPQLAGLQPALNQLRAGGQRVVDGLPAAQTLTLPLPVGTVATVNVRGAAQALLDAATALPTVELLGLTAASSTVAGRCVGGTPTVDGASQTAGLRVLGQELPTNTATERSLSVIDSTNITASQIVTKALADFTVVNPLVSVTPAQLRELLERALGPIPTISIPAQVLKAKVTPAQQERTGGRLVQRALRVELAAFDRALLDLVLGEAAVGTDGVDCSVPPPAPPPDPQPRGQVAAALECTDRRLVLVDVLPDGDRVKLFGAADKRLAGREVDIVFEATRRRVATATIQSDGSFRATAPMPARRLRATNRARYQARLGGERSLNLKLFRRLLVYGVRVADGKVTISGQVVPPLTRPIATISLKRRVSCGTTEVVKRFKPRRDGRFRVTVPAPAGVSATVYRLQTRVLKTSRSRTSSPTFTLPRGVDLLG